MSDSKPTGSSSSAPGATPKAGSGASDAKPVPPTPGSSASAPPAGSSGAKPVPPTPGSSASAPPAGSSGAKPVPPASGSSSSAPPVGGSSGGKPVPSTAGSSGSSTTNPPTLGSESSGSAPPGGAPSGSSDTKPPAATSAPLASSSSCPPGAGSSGAHPIAGSGPAASSSTPPPSPSPASSSKGGNDFDLVATSPTGAVHLSAPPSASDSPIPSLSLAANAPTSSPMPYPFGAASVGSGGRRSYSRRLFRRAPGSSGSAGQPQQFNQQMLSPSPTPNMDPSDFVPDFYQGGGWPRSSESRGPRQLSAGQPAPQGNYGFGSHSREPPGQEASSSCPPLYPGGSRSGQSRGRPQPSTGAPGFQGNYPPGCCGIIFDRKPRSFYQEDRTRPGESRGPQRPGAPIHDDFRYSYHQDNYPPDYFGILPDNYGPGGGSRSSESRGPRQPSAGSPGFQGNYPPGYFGIKAEPYRPRGETPPEESRGPCQPSAGAAPSLHQRHCARGCTGLLPTNFGPGGLSARLYSPLGLFAFLSGPINWQNHPLAVNFASLLRSYLNRNGYRDGVMIDDYGTRQSYGSAGRWNSAASPGMSSGYSQAAPQGGTPPPSPPPPDN